MEIHPCQPLSAHGFDISSQLRWSIHPRAPRGEAEKPEIETKKGKSGRIRKEEKELDSDNLIL